jgi:hypothetical protein
MECAWKLRKIAAFIWSCIVNAEADDPGSPFHAKLGSAHTRFPDRRAIMDLQDSERLVSGEMVKKWLCIGRSCSSSCLSSCSELNFKPSLSLLVNVGTCLSQELKKRQSL